MSGGFCPRCGAAAASDAKFCAACGNALPRAAAPVAETAAASPRPTSEAPPARAPQPPETTVFELRPLMVRTFLELVVCVVTLGIGWLAYWIARMGCVHVVTTQRIETRRGVLTIRREAVELFRVEDFEVVEPLFLRLRGAGNVRIWSMDADDPEILLEAIPGVQAVYEKLRTLTREERRRAGVRVIEGAP